MLTILAALAFVGFVIFAAATQYNNTLATESVPKRVWLSVMAAGMALATGFWTWLHGVTGP